ncbi:hypothetical protein BF49_4926 [Bradyrhizobium sp.]|nr:hypothetical protein BF49_4926 [Bradyrhizobium sp.]
MRLKRLEKILCATKSNFFFAEMTCSVGQNTGMMASWVVCAGCLLVPRHCERSDLSAEALAKAEAIQSPSAERFWIASLRSQ